MKRLIALITTFSMLITILAGSATVNAVESNSISGTVLDYVEFGSYPQTEIIGDTSIMIDDGTIADSELYELLKDESDWIDGIKTIDKIRYCRISRSDSTRTSNANYYNEYYHWSSDKTYSYFRYEPIKWKVLDVNGNDAFLLADIGLDDQLYNTSSTSVTWESSSIRSWLNNIFINRAFSSDEQESIILSTIENADNSVYSTEGGNTTEDKVFLLSESDVYGKTGVQYGFAEDCNANNEARTCRISTYAWAMGVQKFNGKCSWLLRSPGEVNNAAAVVGAYGNVGIGGNDVTSTDYAVRPAIHVNLDSTSKIEKTYIERKVTDKEIHLSNTIYDYDGSPKEPSVKVDGLVNGEDYSIRYSDNTNPGTAKVIITGTGSYNGSITKEFKIEIPEISNPGSLTRDVSYDLIEFGSYPQTEIVYDKEVCGTYGKSWGTSSDYIEDVALYLALMNAEFDNNNDTVIDSVKYHRISRNDATYATTDGDYYYNWSGDAEYRYFKYEPVKWRVLDTDDDDAFLLADIALDDQKYNLSNTSITWDKSTVRSWLNGYGSSVNKCGMNYSERNFIDSAFTEEEQSAIIETTIKTENSKEHGTSGGNDTKDKIFFLSESEVCGSDVAKYGFASDYGTNDKARQSKSSTYAKAMGAFSGIDSGTIGTCFWWLRSPGWGGNHAVRVDFGYVSLYGQGADNDINGIRPALHINLNSSNLYKNAGSTECFSTLKINSINLETDVCPLRNNKTTPKAFVEGLTEGKDYTVSYENNDKVGIATVVIEGIGKWEGTIKRNFAVVDKIDISSMKIEILDEEIKYYGIPCCPAIKVGGLAQVKDYTVTYENNNGVGFGKVIVTGNEENGYKGSIEKTFMISKATIKSKTISIPRSHYSYTGSEIKPTVTIDGLLEGTDYTVSYADNVDIGTATITVTGKGYWGGKLTKEFKITHAFVNKPSAKLGLVYNGSSQVGVEAGTGYTVTGNTGTTAGTYTAVAKLDTNYMWSDGTTGDKNIIWSIAGVNISKKAAKLKNASYVYSGKANKPLATISGLKNGIDYTASYSNNTKCGKATVIIKGLGNYTGTITKYFTITPAKATISKATAGKKKITVSIKSQKTSGVTGYQIYYKKSGSTAKTVYTTSTSKTLSSLAKGKKYTVKVRAYKTIDGKKYYGAYSASKTVTVK